MHLLNIGAQMRTTQLRAIWRVRGRAHYRGLATRNQRDVLTELRDRGFIASLTSPRIAETLRQKTCIYSGVDPSASSLHVGNLLPLLCLLHLQQAGHDVLALIGGATGAIGDPSGRSTERNSLSHSTLNTNVSSITSQVTRFFERGEEYVRARRDSSSSHRSIRPDHGPNGKERRGELRIVNNRDWHAELSFLDFLRDVGKYARVNTMLARESVKNRLITDQGISFTEFSYQLLQAYDFHHLFHSQNCRIQVGGSDQWGNIVAGVDLIKRKSNAIDSAMAITGEGKDEKRAADREEEKTADEAFGLTIPLLTTSTGEKFGKSAGNAVWLDTDRTGVYDFYQFFLRTPDADTPKLLKLFTFLPLEEIQELVSRGEKAPEERLTQKVLAEEVTHLVHGARAVKQAKTATTILFETSLEDLSADSVIDAFENDARLVRIGSEELVGMSMTKLAAAHGLTQTRGDATRLARSGGFYLNNLKMTDPSRTLGLDDLISGRFVVLGAGKTQRIILMLPS